MAKPELYTNWWEDGESYRRVLAKLAHDWYRFFPDPRPPVEDLEWELAGIVQHALELYDPAKGVPCYRHVLSRIEYGRRRFIERAIEYARERWQIAMTPEIEETARDPHSLPDVVRSAQQRLDHALHGMSAVKREILEAHLIDGLAFSEIAKELRLSKRHVFRLAESAMEEVERRAA